MSKCSHQTECDICYNEIEDLKDILREAESEIPASFYANTKLPHRVSQLVRIWQNAIRANQELEDLIEKEREHLNENLS